MAQWKNGCGVARVEKAAAAAAAERGKKRKGRDTGAREAAAAARPAAAKKRRRVHAERAASPSAGGDGGARRKREDEVAEQEEEEEDEEEEAEPEDVKEEEEEEEEEKEEETEEVGGVADEHSAALRHDAEEAAAHAADAARANASGGSAGGAAPFAVEQEGEKKDAAPGARPGGRKRFSDFDLDTRLLRALAKLGMAEPTPVQAEAVPIALKGKDVLARAKTGSGKTAAYSLPVLQKILAAKETSVAAAPATRALILIPTKELAEQVTAHINSLATYCSKQIKVVNIAANVPVQLQQPLLAERPDIVVSTPSRAVSHLDAGFLVLSDLQSVVVDEADLVLSYGYEEDVRKIATTYLPRIYQSFLMSATVTEDVEGLKGMMTRNPAILKLEEEKPDGDLVQYSIVTTEKDKFLLIFSILKLKLIRGKILIFVNDVDRCYRLKLLLEQFGIKSCVLNSELPLNSRCHIVQEFNKGVYDYLIATDEASLQQVESESEGDSDSEGEDFRQRKRAGKKDEPDAEAEGSDSEARAASQRRQRGRRKPRQDKEYGVSRGVDFKNVACVLNFDFPASARAYVHRVGRTARAGKRGMALSFVVPPSGGKRSRAADDEKVLGRVERLLRRGNGAGIPPDAAAAPDGKESDRFIKPYAFNVRQVEGFRYRLEDAMRSVTRVAIREARVKELKAEILNSEKLKAHFEDKPRDLAFLRHDKALRPARVQPHLKHVPSYLMPKLSAPPAGAAAAAADGAAFGRGRGGGGGEAKLARQERRGLRARPGPGGKDNSSRGKRKKADPLKSFSFSGTKGGGRIGKRTRGAGKRAR